MKVAYNRFWPEKFNEEGGKKRETTRNDMLDKIAQMPKAGSGSSQHCLNSSYLSAGKNCSEMVGQDILVDGF